MLGIDCLEQNKSTNIRRVVGIFMSMAGFITVFILIGIYLDTFFNNGISVIVMALLGIFLAFSHLIKLLCDLGEKNDKRNY